MPPQTTITEKRIRMSIMPFMYINVRAGLAPHSLASQPPSTFSHQMGLPHSCLTPQKLCRVFGSIFPKISRIATTIHFFSPGDSPPHPCFISKKYVALSELAASLFCKIFIYQYLIKVYTSTFGKSAGILQTPVI